MTENSKLFFPLRENDKISLVQFAQGILYNYSFHFLFILPIDKSAAMCYTCAARGRLPRAVFLSRGNLHKFCELCLGKITVDNQPVMWYTNYSKGDEVMTNQEKVVFMSAVKAWIKCKNVANFKNLYKVCAIEGTSPIKRVYYIVADTQFNGKYKNIIKHFGNTY